MREMTSQRSIHILVGVTSMLVAGLLRPALVAGQAAPETWRTQGHVEMLSADAFEGRLTGSDGARKAADYIIEQLDAIGATPLPGRDEFRLPFEFTAGVSDGGSSLRVEGGDSWHDVDQVQALSFSDSAAVSGSVVFAGYGLVVPDTQEFSYDSYATLERSSGSPRRAAERACGRSPVRFQTTRRTSKGCC